MDDLETRIKHLEDKMTEIEKVQDVTDRILRGAELDTPSGLVYFVSVNTTFRQNIQRLMWLVIGTNLSAIAGLLYMLIFNGG